MEIEVEEGVAEILEVCRAPPLTLQLPYVTPYKWFPPDKTKDQQAVPAEPSIILPSIASKKATDFFAFLILVSCWRFLVLGAIVIPWFMWLSTDDKTNVAFLPVHIVFLNCLVFR
ncbi:hypothetical protein CEXT_717211 [Caerostris extrusa]|uniref:Uncharacterized protein n=1 Tax=Caerostris extrusa TaxID=172846 RepID=A0AAV4WPK8_CAEEX|nr:hypothetical protein CEXT_717211 [Caerostris extrusa]